MGPSHLLRAARIVPAAESLLRGGTSVEQVAYEAGYLDADRMRVNFESIFGVSPSEFAQTFDAFSASDALADFVLRPSIRAE